MDTQVNGAPPPHSALFKAWTRGLCSYWIPFGVLLFLTGAFWAPRDHNYKIIVTDMLLLPALLSALTFKDWRGLAAKASPLLFVLLYLVYMVAIAALRGNEALAFAHWSFYILLFIFAIGVRMHISANQLVQLLTASVVIAAFAALYALIYDLYSGAIWQSDYRLIGYGSLYNPLKSGHLFGAFTLLGAWCGYVDTRIRRVAWTAAGICFAAVISTGSRAPFLALTVVSLWNIFGTLSGAQRKRALLRLAAVVSAVLLLFWTKLSERGLSLRPEVWKDAAELYFNHPWLGVGLGTDLEIPMSVGDTLYDTHNVFLAVLYYGGAVGLVLFLVAFGSCFWGAWRIRKISSLGYLAASLQLYGLTTLQFDGGSLIGRATVYWILYWLPMGLYLRAIYSDAHTQSPIKS